MDVRLYRVIYDAIADVEAAMKGMLDPIFEEKVIGHAEVRQLFKASGVGTIAGSYVLDGTFQRGCTVRITREGTQIYEGPLASLKRFKDDVKEVRAGYECGLVFEKFNDVQEAGSGRSLYYGRSTKIGNAGFANMRKHSIKNTRINGEVQSELAKIIRGEIKDPRIHPLTSRCSRGSCSGFERPAKHISACWAMKKPGKAYHRRAEKCRRIYHAENWLTESILRNTPEIRFMLDQSIEYGVNMSKLIDDVTKDHS